MLDNGKDSPLMEASSLNVLRKHYASVDGVALWNFLERPPLGHPSPVSKDRYRLGPQSAGAESGFKLKE
jgi:hypothetical protein